VSLRSGAWGIRWGRGLARDLSLPLVESTETTDRAEAERILRVREVQVAEQRGDRSRLDVLRRTTPVVTLDELVGDFLRAFAAGDLPGPKPKPSTVDGYIAHLLGARGGLVPFAKRGERATSDRLDRVLVERWLEEERGRASADTLRLKLIAARRLITFAADRAFIPAERTTALRALRAPAPSRGRARIDGVPTDAEVTRLLGALSPAFWHPVAELQLRLGLRRSEVLAIVPEWLDEGSGAVHVLVRDDWETKDHASRTVDGVDAETFALAREVLALKQGHGLSVSGYAEAWKRACRKLAKAGTPWRYRSKTHALRAAYATASRLAGVPLSVVRDRMGHESERTTERHYLGRTLEVVQGPFAGRPRFGSTPGDASGPGAKVIPIRRAG
jgi:integrase